MYKRGLFSLQMGERSVRIREVKGSNPSGSTIIQPAWVLARQSVQAGVFVCPVFPAPCRGFFFSLPSP